MTTALASSSPVTPAAAALSVLVSVLGCDKSSYGTDSRSRNRRSPLEILMAARPPRCVDSRPGFSFLVLPSPGGTLARLHELAVPPSSHRAQRAWRLPDP